MIETADLVGSWTLVSMTLVPAEEPGKEFEQVAPMNAMGDAPRGSIIYHQDGGVAAVLTQSEPYVEGTLPAGSVGDTSWRAFLSYAGTFSLEATINSAPRRLRAWLPEDGAAGKGRWLQAAIEARVSHNVDVSVDPSWVGTVLTRDAGRLKHQGQVYLAMQTLDTFEVSLQVTEAGQRHSFSSRCRSQAGKTT